MERKHSGLGIASFITNIVVIFTIALLVIGSNLDGAIISQIPLSIYFVFPFVSLVALMLGIGGLIQKDRKKIFAILGTVFSAVIILFFGCFGSLLIIQLSFGM